ncbi:PAS domain S-box protein [Streptomyces paludis]|uniref:PAS domain S-box protein n=1 Tax=Streptomyces paludis TaxID=2282738 RepID=A0A345I286_9ACTN|nr:PAS domain S-box protein [Streptomyces paludis]
MVPDSAAAVFWRNRTTGLFDRIPLPAAFCGADGTILRANPALAAEWGQLAGAFRGRSALELFHPESWGQLRSIAEAIRLHRRSRYPVAVRWTAVNGVERRGEVSVDLVDDTSFDEPNLLVIVRVAEPEAEPVASAVCAGAVDATAVRILALTAGGATTAQIASAVGLTADGVNYHLKRLSRRWGVSGRAALVARAYVTGILAPGAWPPEPARSAGRPGP